MELKTELANFYGNSRNFAKAPRTANHEGEGRNICYGVTNLGPQGIENFFVHHRCNVFLACIRPLFRMVRPLES